MSPALQISIPTTSTATPSGAKPYTQYHIVLQLPLRHHEVRKRYTDFTDLHAALVSQTGAPPPATLPAKSWIWRTVNNDTLTEERRKGLEAYLKSIVDAEDARWRVSSAWRSFLNLPGGASTLNSNGSLSKQDKAGNAGGITDPHQWLEVHRELKTQIHSARQLLKQREAATTAQTQHSSSAEAKASLIRAATSIAQLDDGLRALSSTSKSPDDSGWSAPTRLGEGELRRRRDLLSSARKEISGLESLLKSLPTTSRAPNGGTTAASATPSDKEALWRSHPSTKPSTRVLGGPPAAETARTRELDNAGVLQLQQQIMQDQDQDVLSLGKTVSKLKDMGIMINEELEVQNEMLKLVGEDTERVQGKIDVARKRIGKIS